MTARRPPQRNNNSKMATATINGAQFSIIILPPQISSIGSGAKVAATKRKTFGEMTRRLMSHCHKRRARSADHATHLRICASTWHESRSLRLASRLNHTKIPRKTCGRPTEAQEGLGSPTKIQRKPKERIHTSCRSCEPRF